MIDNFKSDYNFKFSTYLVKGIIGRFSRLKYINITIGEERQRVLKHPPMQSLDAPIQTSHHGDAEEGNAKIDFIEDKSFDHNNVDGKLNEDFIRTQVLPYLSRQDRIIFESVYLDGMSYEQVADVLGTTRQMVENVLHNAEKIAKIRRIYEEGATELDKSIKGISFQRNQVLKLATCHDVINKYGREFLVEKVYPRLTPTQQEIFDYAILDYFGQSERELKYDTGSIKIFNINGFKLTLARVCKIADTILENEKKGRIIETVKLPENIRQKIARVERVLEKYGGKYFLANYFLRILPDNERKAFYHGMLTYRGQAMSHQAKKAGLSMKEFKTCLESATSKLKTTNFDDIVWVVDKSLKDANIVADRDNVIERRNFVDKLGRRRLIDHFVSRLNETQKTVFENLYLMGNYYTAETLSKGTGLSTGVIAKTELEIREMFKDLDAMEAEDMKNQVNNIAGRQTLEYKERLYQRRIDKNFVTKHGGKEFLMFKFAPRLVTRAEVVILRDFICDNMPAEQVLNELGLNKNAFDYLTSTTQSIKLAIRNYKNCFDSKDPDLFIKEVDDFYKMNAYQQEHGNLDERIFGKEITDQFKHVSNVLMNVTTDMKKDELDDIIQSAGGEKVLRRNFAPYKLTGVTENLIFEKTILQKMSCEEASKELDIFPVEVEQVRDSILDKVKKFVRYRNRNLKNKELRIKRSEENQVQLKNIIGKDKGD